MGYVTRGRGISVHLADCPNALRYKETEPERIMPVQWGSNVEGLFSAEMEAICHNRDRLTVDIVNVMAETKTSVTGLKVNSDRHSGSSSIIIKVEVKSLDQFEYLMQRVARIRGVTDVHRMVRHRREEKEK